MQLFLDCDGVLADFDTYVEPLLGERTKTVASVQHDVPGMWQKIYDHDGFYARLPLMADAMELFDAVKHLNPIILTGIPKYRREDGWAVQQKLMWAGQYFPGLEMITCLSENKRDYMEAGDVLVDGNLQYKPLWVEREGIFVLHVSAENSIAELKKRQVL
jgi:hypothetical protein